MVTKTLVIILLLVGPQVHSQPDSVAYYTESGYVEFVSSVPMHSFTGESKNLTGIIDIDSNIIDFYVDLKTFKTGIGKRDRDMYQTLNVEDHPFAEFTGSFVSLPPPLTSLIDSVEVSVTGDFTINNVSKEKTIEGLLIRKKEGLKLLCEFELNLNEHNIIPPGIFFYRVDEIQKINLEALLKPID